MTTRASFDLGLPETEPLDSGSLEARASIALKVLAVINVAGMVLALFPPPLPQSFLRELTFNVAAGALAALEIIVARALDRRRPWAVAIVRPLLVVLIAAGVGAMLVGAQAGVIRLPFEAVIAVWALLGPRDATLAGRTDRRGTLVVASTALLVVAMLARQPLFGWGGLLDARQSDLRTSINADCGAAEAGPPPTITVTYDWSWARTSPLPSGLDIVVLGWTGTDADGHQLYYYDTTPPTGAGIYSGRRDYPSIDMATQISKTSPASWSWGVELGEQGMQPGRIELQMRRAREAPPNPGPLVFTASYVHLGIWHSDPVSVTCSWASSSRREHRSGPRLLMSHNPSGVARHCGGEESERDPRGARMACKASLAVARGSYSPELQEIVPLPRCAPKHSAPSGAPQRDARRSAPYPDPSSVRRDGMPPLGYAVIPGATSVVPRIRSSTDVIVTSSSSKSAWPWAIDRAFCGPVCVGASTRLSSPSRSSTLLPLSIRDLIPVSSPIIGRSNIDGDGSSDRATKYSSDLWYTAGSGGPGHTSSSSDLFSRS